MGKSVRLRLREVRDVFRLIGECRERGHDPQGWVRHALEGLQRLMGSRISTAMELRPEPPGTHWIPTYVVDLGWHGDAEREFWARNYTEGLRFEEQSTFRIYWPLALSLPHRVVTRSRQQLVDEARWRRSVEYNEVLRPIDCDDLMSSYVKVASPEGQFGLNFTRSTSEPPFGGRERTLLHLFQVEMSRLLGTALARDAAGPLAGLPPRLRQTLECLLSGDSEKQVALRLGLSRHTIHDYVTALYRHFRVNSRPELLALFLKRRDRRIP